MKKLKEFLQKIEFKKLFKNIGLSIIMLYTILNIGILTQKYIYSFGIMNYLITDTNDKNVLAQIDESIFQNGEEHIKNLQKEAEESLKNGDANSFTIYESKYPAMVTLFQQTLVDLDQDLNVLRISISFGIFIGISLYIFSKEKKIINLIIKYVILVICIILLSLLSIDTVLLPPGIYVSYEEEIVYFISAIDIILILTRCINTIYTKKKLNKLIRNEEKL